MAAEASGVAFSVDPVSGDPDTLVIGAVYGLGEGLVQGDLDADTYRVRRSGDGAPVSRDHARERHGTRRRVLSRGPGDGG